MEFAFGGKKYLVRAFSPLLNKALSTVLGFRVTLKLCFWLSLPIIPLLTPSSLSLFDFPVLASNPDPFITI